MINISNPTEICPVSCLADYVRRVRNEKDFSLTEVSARSGGRISKTHINRIENGAVSRVSLLKLRALARGLDASEDELIAAAQGKPPGRGAPVNERKLLDYFGELSPDRQEHFLAILQAIAKRTRLPDPNPKVPAAMK